MAPIDVANSALSRRWDGSWKDGISTRNLIVESWSQGFMISALIIMAGVTVANMSHRLLHKLILLELCLAMLHGTFCFMNFEGYGWYVSATATLLYLSYYLHNVVAWIKNRPFFSRWVSHVYIGTLLLVAPYWILEIYANFAFNNNISQLFETTRYFEALFRDPWWIFTCISLVYNIRKRYNFPLWDLIRTCPRFGIMLVSMSLSVVFLILDVTFTAGHIGGAEGINPFWKFSLVFKCFCDTIILDDFKSALDRLRTAVFGQHVTPLNNLSNVRSTNGRSGPSGGYAGQVSGKPVTVVFSNNTDSRENRQESPIDPKKIFIDQEIAVKNGGRPSDVSEGNTGKS